MKLMTFDLSGLLSTILKGAPAPAAGGDTVLLKIIVQLAAAKR